LYILFYTLQAIQKKNGHSVRLENLKKKSEVLGAKEKKMLKKLLEKESVRKWIILYGFA